MARLPIAKFAGTRYYVEILVLVIALVASPFPKHPVYADQVTHRSISLSSDLASATNVKYDVAFTIATTSPLGSIDLLFCSNSPLTGEVCTPPNDLDVTSGVTLSSQSGQTGFAISSSSTANELILSRPPQGSNAGDVVEYELSGVANPSVGGPLYARIATYASSDASGPFINDGGLAMVIRDGVAVNAEVPPFLTFCLGESITGFDCSTATEPFADLGILSSTITSAAQSQVVVTTNAGNGYTMWANGTTMTSGNNIIAAMNNATSQKGIPQFGLNARANTVPQVGQNPSGPGSGIVMPDYNNPDHFKFLSGDPLVSSSAPEDNHKFTISYVVNIPSSQPGGVYSTTLTYTCLANF